MSWFVEHWIASLLLVIYVSVLFYNAYVGNKAATGVGGYYVGNRQLGGTVVGISFFATFASTNTFIGHPGEDDEQNGHGEPRHTVVVAFARMSNKGVGRGKRRKKGDADNGTAQLAVTYVISTNASCRLVSDVGVVEQHGYIDQEE